MIIVMFTQLMNMMPYVGQGAFQFSYVKRFFGWAVTEYSWYITTGDLLSAFATIILFPLFHKFRVTNNSVIMLACISQVTSHQAMSPRWWPRACEGWPRSPGTSTQVPALMWAPPWWVPSQPDLRPNQTQNTPPIRAQLSQCVEAEELVLQDIVPAPFNFSHQLETPGLLRVELFA